MCVQLSEIGQALFWWSGPCDVFSESWDFAFGTYFYLTKLPFLTKTTCGYLICSSPSVFDLYCVLFVPDNTYFGSLWYCLTEKGLCVWNQGVMMFIWDCLTLRLEPNFFEEKWPFWPDLTRLCLIYSSPGWSYLFSYVLFMFSYRKWPLEGG